LSVHHNAQYCRALLLIHECHCNVCNVRAWSCCPFRWPTSRCKVAWHRAAAPSVRTMTQLWPSFAGGCARWYFVCVRPCLVARASLGIGGRAFGYASPDISQVWLGAVARVRRFRPEKFGCVFSHNWPKAFDSLSVALGSAVSGDRVKRAAQLTPSERRRPHRSGRRRAHGAHTAHTRTGRA
jgi:hypothetical protein